MEDTKKILQKFYVNLRNNVNATAVYREVLGLSQFDRELIIAQRTNTEAVDKLVDIVGSRSTRSFVSFVDALKKHDHIEIVDNILLVAKQNYPQIHRVLVTPTATVTPSNTELTQIAYEDVMQWVEELNKSKQWKKLATKMKLNYQTVKDLEKEEEPVDAFFHQHCSNLTIKRFLNYLTKAGLTSVLAMVRNRIDERYDSSGFQQTSLQEEGNNAPVPAELSYDTHATVQPMNFLNRDDSIIDNTQIPCNDNKPSSPLISKRTNIGSVSNNDTSFNIGNVDNLTMIYTMQGDTKSSLSDTDGSMKPAEIEKNILVDDEEVVNQQEDATTIWE
ncbi:Hypothetical predicted protein [Mytilus galloprovincialis]|uniref:Death domain-containing protein n=1 Tax=Mytilus galloprovincialis TaxID=29158 RepID=A0A8B6CEX9_MYTGA|nr:Hypothetical predicted protein [Mytilus galloprovincialis]